MICQNPATVRDGCVNKHFGALLSHTSRMLRRAMDTRIAAEVTPELTGVRGMLLGEIICANNENRDVYQRDVEQWFHIRRSSVTAILQGMEAGWFHHPLLGRERCPLKAAGRHPQRGGLPRPHPSQH